MSDLKALVVDDDKGIRETLATFLSAVDIDSSTYETAEELLAYLFPAAVIELADMPDLIVIDLQLKKGCMQGIDLISYLSTPKKNVPSSLMAISGVIPSIEHFENVIAFGTAVLLPKPFSIDDFGSKAKRLAGIGKRRRLKRIELENNRYSPRDENRFHRPVFISYAREEELIANGIRIHIEALGVEVWYGPTTIDAGAEWQREIVQGVNNAFIFIPILSDSFLYSSMCINELNRFLNRIENDEMGDLLFLPIVGRLSDRGKNHEVFTSIAEKYQITELYPRLVDSLTSITGSLQAHLRRIGKKPHIE